MDNRRLLRVAELLREEISSILQRLVHDPRVSDKDFTILRVDVSPDLGHATVRVSTLLANEPRNELIEGMQRAAGFIRHELMGRVSLKTVPELRFFYDGGLVQSQHITDLLNTLKQETT